MFDQAEIARAFQSSGRSGDGGSQNHVCVRKAGITGTSYQLPARRIAELRGSGNGATATEALPCHEPDIGKLPREFGQHGLQRSFPALLRSQEGTASSIPERNGPIMKNEMKKNLVERVLLPRVKESKPTPEGFITFQWEKSPYGIPIRQTLNMTSCLNSMREQKTMEDKNICPGFSHKMIVEDSPRENQILVNGWPSFVYEALHREPQKE
jgi:hypothetical protein